MTTKTPAPSTLNRRLFSEAVIGLSLCLGLHFALVDPLRHDLATTRAEISALQSALPLGAASEESLPRAMNTTKKSKQQAERIHQTGLVARNEGALFARIMQLAEHSGVRIDQMEPRQQQPGAAPLIAATPGEASSAAPVAVPPRPTDVTLAYSITITTEYSNLCSFVAFLQHDLGYTLIKSIRAQTTSDPASPLLTATLETAHYAFDASPVALVTAPAEGADQ